MKIWIFITAILTVGCSSIQPKEQKCNALIPNHYTEDKKLLFWTNDEELSSLKFKFKNGEVGPIARNLDGSEIDEIEVTPSIAFAVESGWLLGFNHGEWGGALTYKGLNETEYQILKINVQNVYAHPLGHIVVSGLEHLRINEGKIHLIKLVSDKYVALELKTLDSSPESSWQMQSGDIVINYGKGLISILDETGKLTTQQCKVPEYGG